MLTIQKLHKVIREQVGVLSSKYAPSQKIDRTTYSVKEFKGCFCVMSGKHIIEIAEALRNANIKFDDKDATRGFLKVFKSEEWAKA